MLQETIRIYRPFFLMILSILGFVLVIKENRRKYMWLDQCGDNALSCERIFALKETIRRLGSFFRGYGMFGFFLF